MASRIITVKPFPTQSQAFREAQMTPLWNGSTSYVAPIVLFFSVNASGHFCGVAIMSSDIDWNRSSSVWSLGNKWKGVFDVKWLFVKDVRGLIFFLLRRLLLTFHMVVY